MSGPGWDNDAWQQIRDYERFWGPFEARFHLRAGMRFQAWPAIHEPTGSVTFDTQDLEQGNVRSSLGTDDLRVRQ